MCVCVCVCVCGGDDEWLFAYVLLSLPRWYRGNVLASRSKVRGRDFKPWVPSLRFQAR